MMTSKKALSSTPRPGRSDIEPKRRARRKESRPDEIVAAATEVFLERGYGAARLDDIARRAHVSKGTLFVYFENKEALFRAVARAALTSNLAQVEQVAASPDIPLETLIPSLLGVAAQAAETEIVAIARLLVAESRLFPDLPRAWHDEVVSKVLGVLTNAIARAQARGEVRPGDPNLLAFSIMGPILAGVLFRDIFADTDAVLPDLRKLAAQHASIVLHGALNA